MSYFLFTTNPTNIVDPTFNVCVLFLSLDFIGSVRDLFPQIAIQSRYLFRIYAIECGDGSMKHQK